MLGITLRELKEQELGKVKDLSNEIATKMKDANRIISYSVFAVSYLAYLVSVKDMKNTNELIAYVDEEFTPDRAKFIKDCIDDSWNVVFEIKNMFTINTLLAAILWLPMSNGKNIRESETPESIAKLAIGLLDICNDSVADLCSGAGSFLIEAISKDDNSDFYGIEYNSIIYEISKIRFQVLRKYVEIEQGSAFYMESSRKFDKVFCDYPWNVKVDTSLAYRPEFNDFTDEIVDVRKLVQLDWLFIYNALHHLKEDGKAVVMTTNGITWNGGISKDIREKFIKNGWVEAVIALPRNMYSSISIPTTMLVLSKGNQTVRMIDASEMALEGRRINTLTDETIANIVDMMKKDTPASKSVTFEEIAAQDYEINPSRFLVEDVEMADGVPLGDLVVNITRGAQIKASELDEMVSKEETDYQYLMLANIQDGMISEELPYIKTLDKKLEKYCLKNNNLVLSKNGVPVKIAVASVAEGKKILANGNLYILEVDEKKMNPIFLKAYLESESGTNALTRVTVGTAMPNIPLEGLRKILVPCPSIETQNKVAKKYLEKVKEIKELKRMLEQATEELKTICFE